MNAKILTPSLFLLILVCAGCTSTKVHDARDLSGFVQGQGSQGLQVSGLKTFFTYGDTTKPEAELTPLLQERVGKVTEMYQHYFPVNAGTGGYEIHLTQDKAKINWAAFTGTYLLSLPTVFLIPTVMPIKIPYTLEVRDGNNTVYRSQVQVKARSQVGWFAPLMGVSGDKQMQSVAQTAAYYHLEALQQDKGIQGQQLATAVESQDLDALVNYASKPDSIYQKQAMQAIESISASQPDPDAFNIKMYSRLPAYYRYKHATTEPVVTPKSATAEKADTTTLETAETTAAGGQSMANDAAAAAPQAPVDNTAADVAAQCAKRYVALKACDKIPMFGAKLCRSQVEKKYNHLACQLIN